MNNIEDEIRRAMIEHDRDAPAAADLMRALESAAETRGLGPSARAARWQVPLLAAAAVAAVIAGTIWAGGLLAGHRPPSSGTSHASPLSCPARYARPAPWVPAKPTGVDGRSRLAPLRTPTSALICAYAGMNIGKQSGWALSGRRVLDEGFARLAAQLAWQPRKVHGQDIVCTLVGGNQTNYLIGLTYTGGRTLWVATTVDPNACVNTSNGRFTSFGSVGSIAGRALRTGRWPPTPPPSCRRTGQGRLGQQTSMVPPGSTSLLICRAGRVIRSGYGSLVAALNALPTRVSTRGCSGRGPSGQRYRLLFSYPSGPPTVVDIMTGCYPEIDNLSLQANSAKRILPIIGRLLHAG